MKAYIHPARSLTLLQRPDGRTFYKSWAYLRPQLLLETDQTSKVSKTAVKLSKLTSTPYSRLPTVSTDAGSSRIHSWRERRDS